MSKEDLIEAEGAIVEPLPNATFRVELSEGIGGATMAIYDVVTDTDAAGNPTERSNFDFSFKELTSTIPSK